MDDAIEKTIQNCLDLKMQSGELTLDTLGNYLRSAKFCAYRSLVAQIAGQQHVLERQKEDRKKEARKIVQFYCNAGGDINRVLCADGTIWLQDFIEHKWVLEDFPSIPEKE